MALSQIVPSKAPPITRLEHKDIIRLGMQELLGRSPERRALFINVVPAALRPYQVEGGAGLVFPAQDGIAAQGFVVKIGIVKRKGSRRAGTVRIDFVFSV